MVYVCYFEVCVFVCLFVYLLYICECVCLSRSDSSDEDEFGRVRSNLSLHTLKGTPFGIVIVVH